MDLKTEACTQRQKNTLTLVKTVNNKIHKKKKKKKITRPKTSFKRGYDTNSSLYFLKMKLWALLTNFMRLTLPNTQIKRHQKKRKADQNYLGIQEKKFKTKYYQFNLTKNKKGLTLNKCVIQNEG